MATYLSKVRYHISSFETWQIQQVPWTQNIEVDSLARFALVLSSKLSRTILVECLEAPSIQDKELLSLTTNPSDGLQAPIIWYLCDEVESTSKGEARKLNYKASHYVLIDDMLYKRGHSMPLLKCLDHDEVNYMLRKGHEGVCGNHFAGRSLIHKVLR